MFSRLFLDRLGIGRLPAWLLGMIFLGGASGLASAQEMPGAAPLPAVAALSAVLMNPATGEVLFAKEPHLRLPPASTTKVLTALVALERLDPNGRVLVSAQAASAPPSRIGLRPGDAALTQDLLYGLLLKSGNDAAETLAEAAGGSVPGFAELMNAKAWQIGARNSHFMNPHGLPNDDHYSTAYDQALIFRQAITHPLFADIIGTRSAALRIESGQGFYGNARLVPVVTHNRLLASYEGARGGKTGFTFKARHCFVGEVDRGGIPLIVAVFNSPSRGTLWQDARNLLDYGFARYGLAAPPPAPPEPVLRMAMVRLPAGQRSRVAVENDDDDDRDARSRRATPAPVRATAAAKQNRAMVRAVAVNAPKGKLGVAMAAKASKGKPVAVVAIKPDKRALPKVAVRVEPVTGSKAKNSKPRS
ncbi:MAG: D-alanyl-D-alanine carboxypeptidase [Candidatus Contendobacter sp.]|nr:D-alanyl-D-alanine carboxypeptidase [Candidatus Contendobacter sp.]